MPQLTPDPFKYIKPDDTSVFTLNKVNDAVVALYEVMLSVIDDSRERSVAITKLQEVRMWANCAIVMAQERGK